MYISLRFILTSYYQWYILLVGKDTGRTITRGDKMDKETWKRHLETSAGIIRPSLGGNKNTWLGTQVAHYGIGCEICLGMVAQRKADKIAMAKENLANMVEDAENHKWQQWTEAY